MAITLTPIDLSITNPRLAGLANREYAKTYTGVPNDKLPAEMQTGLGFVYMALTGRELGLGDTTIAISANQDSKRFNRLYAPKLYARGPESAEGTPQLYIRWGNEQIELVEKDGKLVPAVNAKGYKVSTKFALFNPSGRGEDPALEIKVTPPKAEDGSQVVYTCLVAVAPKDWKAYTAAEFETVLETDVTALIDLLDSEGERNSGGGGNITGEVTDDKSILTAVFGSPESQTRALEFTIVGVKEVKAKYGRTWILQAQPSTDADVTSQLPECAVSFGIWAPRFVKSQLSSDPAPTISAEMPATLVIPVGSMSVLRFAEGAVAVQEGGLDLSFD